MPSSPDVRRNHHRTNLDLAARTLEAMKLASGCIDCGYRAHPAALHFDHRDPATKTRELGWYDDRSKLFTRTRLQRFLTHVETYCDIRCANCHAVRTTREKHWLPRQPVASAAPTLF